MDENETGNMGELGMKSKSPISRSLLDRLPEHLIHHILFSFSPPNNRKAVQLSLVSKHFFRLMQNRPALISEHGIFRFPGAELRYMLSTLKRYQEKNIHLDTLTFHTNIDILSSNHLPAVVECIELAAEKRLTNLRLTITHRLNCVLPEAVFGVKSLVRLALCGFNLQEETTTGFPNLRKLDLCWIHMSNEAVFVKLIKGCPLIETLNIYNCCGNISGFNFKVSNLPNLKELHATLTLSDQTLQLCASAATSLESVYCCYDSVYPDPPHSSTCNKIMNLGEHEYPNLKKLYLFKARVDGNLFINFASKFPRLECLAFGSDPEMPSIDLSSPTLREIRIDVDSKHPLKACFDVPNIVELQAYYKVSPAPKLLFKSNSGLGGERMSQMNVERYSELGGKSLLITFPPLL